MRISIPHCITGIYKEDVDFFKPRQSKDIQQQDIPTQVEWVAFKNQFFSSVLHC